MGLRYMQGKEKRKKPLEFRRRPKMTKEQLLQLINFRKEARSDDT